MVNFDIQELIGTFESIYEEETRIKDLQGQIKMIKMDTVSRMKEFAEEKEIKLKAIKDSYKYWKELKNSGEEPDNSDYFDLVARIENSLGESLENAG